MHVKNIKFENFSGYLNNMYYYSGYGGMVWNDMYEVQSAFINEHTWCDTGYNNALSGQGEAITLGTGGFESANLYRTFNLVGGTFASAWESKQPVYMNSYVYTPGQGLTLKASDVVTIGEDAKTINFTKFGTDFKNIAAVNFVSGVGQAGNTCSYGTPTYGYILVMDNLQVKWNGNGGGKGHAAPRGGFPNHVLHHNMPHLGANFSPLSAHDGHDADGQTAGHAGNAHDAPYHTELFALPGHESGGLTGQFALPQAEHFGT